LVPHGSRFERRADGTDLSVDDATNVDVQREQFVCNDHRSPGPTCRWPRQVGAHHTAVYLDHYLLGFDAHVGSSAESAEVKGGAPGICSSSCTLRPRLGHPDFLLQARRARDSTSQGRCSDAARHLRDFNYLLTELQSLRALLENGRRCVPGMLGSRRLLRT
jgi:hypothetical protein